jgi:hypothetical protein
MTPNLPETQLSDFAQMRFRAEKKEKKKRQTKRDSHVARWMQRRSSSETFESEALTINRREWQTYSCFILTDARDLCSAETARGQQWEIHPRINLDLINLKKKGVK